MKKQFRDFESAREFVRSLGLSGEHEWQEYCKSGNKPDDIPSSPKNNYKKDFKGVGDWLGTGTIATKYRVFRSFTEAREFARALNLKGQKEWFEYTKSDNKPDDIPSSPNSTYKNEFKGMDDWLGNEYRPFTEAREFVRSLGLKNNKEWKEYCKSGNKPDDIPTNPRYTYKNKGWKGMGDWLGTGYVAPKNRIHLSFNDARVFVQKLGITKQKEWMDYCKSGNKPDNIPRNIWIYYKKEWKGWGDFLGTGTVAPKNKIFRPFKEAREFVQKLELNSGKEWQEYCKSGNKPDDIPSDPKNIYKKEWKGLGDWLGTGIIASYNKQFRPFKEAREFVRELNLKDWIEWQEYCKSGNKPDDIPAAPWKTYKEWKKK